LLLPLLQLELFPKGKERTTLGAPLLCLGRFFFEFLAHLVVFRKRNIFHISVPPDFSSLFSLVGSFLYKGTAVPGLYEFLLPVFVAS
jgi:hypothetical protein